MEYKKISGCNIFIKNIESENFKKYLPYACGHYTLPVYYRLLIPEIFPDIDKILYLDCDLVVVSDIFNLFRIYLKDSSTGMFEDFNKCTFNTKLKMNNKSIYYNAGMILLNSKAWREQNISKNFFDFAIKNKDNINFPIQDTLNPLLEGKVFTIDKLWNSQVFYDQNTKEVIYNFDLKKDKPKIIHYIGNIKPWDSNYGNSILKEQYFKYRKLTYSKLLKVRISLNKKVKYFLDKIIRI